MRLTLDDKALTCMLKKQSASSAFLSSAVGVFTGARESVSATIKALSGTCTISKQSTISLELNL